MSDSDCSPVSSGLSRSHGGHESCRPGCRSTTILDHVELAALPVAERLDCMTRALYRAMSVRDFSSQALTYLSSSFRMADVDPFVPTSGGSDDYVATLRRMTGNNLMYEHDILSSSAEVDEDRGEGTVFVTLRATGLAPHSHMVHESVSRLRWVYKGRQIGWVCAEHAGIRGGGHLGGGGPLADPSA